MAMAGGGYDANFVEEVAIDLKCVVCHFPLRKPVQVIQCGHRFCEECFEQMKDYSITRNTDFCCPFDRIVINPNQVFPDKGLERMILSLKVRCSNVGKGCIWVNDLRDLKPHLEADCDYTIVTCPNEGCKKKIQCNALQQHVCQCSDQRGVHYDGKEIKDLIGDLSSRLLVCEMQVKEKDERLVNCERELKMTKDRLGHCEAKLYEKDEIIERLSCVNSMGFFQWTINNYDVVKWSDNLTSPSFYSSNNGYKCQLSAQWFGPKKGRMGLYFYLCKGENDDELAWPFSMKVRLQSTDSNGVIRSVTVSSLTDNESGCWGSPESMLTNGIGSREFLQMPQLEKHIRNNKMVINCFFDQ